MLVYWLMIRCYLAKISQKRYILHWLQYRSSYFEHTSVSENGARSAKMACCYMNKTHGMVHILHTQGAQQNEHIYAYIPISEWFWTNPQYLLRHDLFKIKDGERMVNICVAVMQKDTATKTQFGEHLPTALAIGVKLFRVRLQYYIELLLKFHAIYKIKLTCLDNAVWCNTFYVLSMWFSHNTYPYRERLQSLH